MLVAFRADASLQIGNGHVMRCLTLADTLRQRGAHCFFVCRPHEGNLIELIVQQGYKVLVLNKLENVLSFSVEKLKHSNWLGTDWTTDAEDARQALENELRNEVLDWLVVDHYALDYRWERTLRSKTKRIMVIDDLADRPHDCDLLLDQNLGRRVEDYTCLVDINCVTLIGPKYALLRPDFTKFRAQSVARRANFSPFSNLLIAVGGVDKDNVTGLVLDALKACTLPADLKVTVIMGSNAPWLEQVQQQAATMPCSTIVMVGVRNMAQLMASSDLSIGAAGCTSWERCCLGLPTLLLVLAENQQSGAIALQKEGAAIVLEVGIQLKKTLNTCLSIESVQALMKTMPEKAAKICDGKGAERTAVRVFSPQLFARKVTQSDEILLFDWVNDAAARSSAFNSASISLDDHKIWFAERISRLETCRIFIVEKDRTPIGQVRLDKNSAGEWEVDYSVAPNFRGQGLGETVLRCVLKEFSGENHVTIVAKVKCQNEASCRVFAALNFEVIGIFDDVLFYRKKLGC